MPLREINEDKGNLIDGIMVSIFSDAGPVVKYNSSSIPEEIALNLCAKGVVMVGEATQKEIYGPLPVPGSSDLLALAFAMNLATSDSSDDRIKKFGRSVVFWLIFNSRRKRNVLHASGLIQGYLIGLVLDIQKESDFTTETIEYIDNKLTDMIVSINIRVYGLLKNDEFVELIDDSLVPASEVLFVADLRRKVLYILFLAKVGPQVRRSAFQNAKKINKDFYKFGLREYAVEDTEESSRILNEYSISTVRMA